MDFTKPTRKTKAKKSEIQKFRDSKAVQSIKKDPEKIRELLALLEEET